MSRGLYVHIPFCIRKCYYCDFNSFRLRGPERDHFLDLLEQEADRWAARLEAAGGVPVLDTLYVGGGTPTTLEAGQLARLFGALRQRFPLAPQAEITVEANPGTLTLEKLAALREAGVNRLSLGAQVFDDGLLRRLGREHDAAAIETSVALAREAGIPSLNLDLIFALPGQDLRGWRATLQRALALEPDHLSCYSLIIEEGTPFYRWHQMGRLPRPDEEEELAMYQAAIEAAEGAGLAQYEISNFARPGHQSRHNLIYWRNQPYLGLGPGAHSWWEGVRRANLGPLPAYEAALQAGRLPLEREEPISRALEMDETMFLGLRLTREGVDRAAFRARFGTEPEAVYGLAIDRLVRLGLLEADAHRIRLTRQGVPVANQVFLAFLRTVPTAV
ncbi:MULTISPECIES: radical SAM family heme chaperone HemW [Limnochorda]|uniref:radical SAM family heme chaperone HemW n=1 Tax=Limnochorda TaxID=1676651 RepID=UPI0018544230|nr:radical SAM family heme chaperone HemW [Limnochorda pilosa]MBO2486497.1 coproporphyrinogen III oxidase [Bacillota bacterium]MBO2519555.1 coproporphyrinogen III oxidase [Bacillota bacterium]NMA72350.1 radical SAM family heme chaperone HemW [Bacillota bacterium]